MFGTDVGRHKRIALIGYGAIADLHADALEKANARPVVVAGPKADDVRDFAARHGIAESSDDVAATIARSDLDAAVLATPSGVHAEQARAALEAGLHVLVEIPLALSYARGVALVEQAAAAGRLLMVCHTLRYWQAHDAAHAWLRDGGHDVRHVVARGLSLRIEDVGWTGRRRSWTDDVLWHHGGHTIDEVLRLLRKPVTTITASVGPVWEGSGRSMDYAITLRCDDGAIATIALSYNARVGASDYVVISDKDTLTINGTDVTTSQGPLVEGVDPDTAQVAAIDAQDRDFLRAIGGGPAPVGAAAEVLPVLAIQQAVADGTSNRG